MKYQRWVEKQLFARLGKANEIEKTAIGNVLSALRLSDFIDPEIVQNRINTYKSKSILRNIAFFAWLRWGKAK